MRYWLDARQDEPYNSDGSDDELSDVQLSLLFSFSS